MSALRSVLPELAALCAAHARPQRLGRVARTSGLVVEAHVPDSRIGDTVAIERPGEPDLLGEIAGFQGETARIVPFHRLTSVVSGARVRSLGDGARLPVSERLLGRIVDAFGRPLDDGPTIPVDALVPLDAPAPLPAHRIPIHERFDTGVRSIDALLTCGVGQRVGLFAGAGVGKTLLMRQIARQARADVTVIGLIGERGGEVQDLLASYRLEHGVLVVSTSDRAPAERARGALAAMAIAEYFRDRGARVLFILDSLTRYAMALREIGLAAGEPPATKGYPPSVFAALPRLLERACPLVHGGSITGFFTVLVEGDDLSDPVADSARSLLDAHIVLSRELAGRGHFPAIDLLASASRAARQVTDDATHALVRRARQLAATRKEADELRSLGAYVPGHHPAYDAALAVGPDLDRWARQEPLEASTFEEACASLEAVVQRAEEASAAGDPTRGQRARRPPDARAGARDPGGGHPES